MIIGDGVRLRAIEKSDLPHFVEWFNDSEVTENLLLHIPLSLDKEQMWYESMLKGPQASLPLMIEIKTPEGWVAVGDCSFHNIEETNRCSEVGIVIGDKTAWNKGIGTEAMRLLLRHGFLNLNLNRIYLHVYETNPRGIRCYEKAGYVQEGRLRQAVYKNGRYLDVIVMSVLRSEWDALNQRKG